jgi:hypothetical protein
LLYPTEKRLYHLKNASSLSAFPTLYRLEYRIGHRGSLMEVGDSL